MGFNMYLSNRDFLGEKYYILIKQEFDNARHYLKTCGKPKDSIDLWFINEAKFTIKLLGHWVK